MHSFDMLRKEKYLHEISVYFHRKNFFSPLPSLGAHIRCAQSWYTAVRMDLKYNLAVDGFPHFVTFVSLSIRCNFINAVTAPALSFGSVAL